ncbi:MAG: polymer-forming cytoskeletal protein [Deltaproteobacteria bacterium]|nr:polymer-forming cytoskeletal protein [Deltaproteobacteria bacterium]
MSKPNTNGGASGQSSASGSGNLTAFIDQGSEFEGKLSFKDTVRIDGSFSGEISSDNTLIVGESGQIRAKIRSVRIVISGYVEGDIVATEQVVLHKSAVAVVSGDIQSPSLVMEEGAQLNGAVRMSSDSASSGDTSSVSPIRSQDAKQAGEKSKVS